MSARKKSATKTPKAKLQWDNTVFNKFRSPGAVRIENVRRAFSVRGKKLHSTAKSRQIKSATVNRIKSAKSKVKNLPMPVQLFSKKPSKLILRELGTGATIMIQKPKTSQASRVAQVRKYYSGIQTKNPKLQKIRANPNSLMSIVLKSEFDDKHGWDDDDYINEQLAEIGKNVTVRRKK